MTSSNHPNPTLSDTQLVLLSAAARRDDGLLVPPERIKGATLAAALKALLRRGLIEAVAAQGDQPASPVEEAERLGRAKITRAGLDAIGIMAESDANAVPTDDPQHSATPKSDRVGKRTAAAGPSPEPAQAEPVTRAPRPGTKRMRVIGLLSREHGATLDDLMAATGWLAHTTRAALTGLRQIGYRLERSKDADGRTTYRVAGGPTAASVEQAAS